MKFILTVLWFVLVPCLSRSVFDVDNDSVVSVYTTPTTAGPTSSLDVYHQIANNIAERITSPIYRFFGYKNQTNITQDQMNITQEWGKIELDDEIPEMLHEIDNNIEATRDVEALSVEALKRTDKKPEKITLYSSYLPLKEKNETITDDDFDDFNLNESEKRGEGFFTYVFEWIASVAQIAWGFVSAIFTPSTNRREGSAPTL